MKSKEPFDFERFKAEAMESLYQGKKMGGTDGVFAPMLKHLLESMLEEELDNHIQESKGSDDPNRRNGKTRKTVRSLQSGEFELEGTRDRNGTFEPKIVPKRQLIITAELEDSVIAMYARGMSTRNISDYVKEMYAMDILATEISNITDKIIPAMNEWRNRSLEAVYPFVFLDCMHYKVRDSGSIESRAVYNILGVNRDGKKELIGVYLSENEGAKFWLSLLMDLKQRGVEDILVACIDGLKGFPEAIETVFPKTQIQLCIVHQIRTSLRYVPEKDKKAVVADLKPVYKANNQEQGYEKLLEFEDKWGKKYPLSVKGWMDNWTNLSTYFEYSPDIRRVIYTTNAIEAMHRQIRKITKTKGAFTSDQSLLKLVYLSYRDFSKKWTMPMWNWGLTMSQLYIKFGDRLKASTKEEVMFDTVHFTLPGKTYSANALADRIGTDDLLKSYLQPHTKQNTYLKSNHKAPVNQENSAQPTSGLIDILLQKTENDFMPMFGSKRKKKRKKKNQGLTL